MEPSILDHLLRTLAAIPPGRRVLVRGADAAAAEEEADDEGRVAGPLARLGLEVHAAPWTDDAARRLHRAAEESDAPGVYAAAGPAGTLPYPEGHFGWVVVLGGRLGDATEQEQEVALRALLEEARHHLRSGGWVFVAAPPDLAPEDLAAAAKQADLAEAEAPEQDGPQARGIYRRVDEETPL